MAWHRWYRWGRRKKGEKWRRSSSCSSLQKTAMNRMRRFFPSSSSYVQKRKRRQKLRGGRSRFLVLKQMKEIGLLYHCVPQSRGQRGWAITCSHFEPIPVHFFCIFEQKSALLLSIFSRIFSTDLSFTALQIIACSVRFCLSQSLLSVHFRVFGSGKRETEFISPFLAIDNEIFATRSA